MPETDSNSVPRTPEEPTPKQVLEEMNPCEPYIVSDPPFPMRPGGRFNDGLTPS